MTDQLPVHGEIVTIDRRPVKRLSESDFAVIQRPVRHPGPGEVLIRNLASSVDPYQRRMLLGDSRHLPQATGEPINAGSVGIVIASRDPRTPVGTQVATYSGWSEYTTRTIERSEHAPARLGDPADWLHVLGTPGVTAWIAIRLLGKVVQGQRVLVTGAAGAVGGIAVQLARASGATVIATAAGPTRTRYVAERLGADVAVDHTAPDFASHYRQVLGDRGIDLIFDSVGGPLLNDALPFINRDGLALLSGVAEQHLDTPLSASLPQLLRMGAQIRAFNAPDFYPEFQNMARWQLAHDLKRGQVSTAVTMYEGLRSAPFALLDTAENRIGKKIVRIAEWAAQ